MRTEYNIYSVVEKDQTPPAVKLRKMYKGMGELGWCTVAAEGGN